MERLFDTQEGLTLFLKGSNEPQNQLGVSEFEKHALAFAQNVEGSRQRGLPYSKITRKRAYVAELTYLLQKQIQLSLNRYGKTFEEFLSMGPNWLLDFFAQLPCLNTEIELATERNEHWQRKIDKNDMADLHFLSVAIPYSDIVVTEKLWANMAKRRHIDTIYKTTILSDLVDLLEYV